MQHHNENLKKINRMECGAKRFAEHFFGKDRLHQLVILDFRDKGKGFSGQFYMPDSLIPMVETGDFPGEVCMKLAERPALRDYRDAIRALPLTDLDRAA